MPWAICNTLKVSATFANNTEIENVSVGTASYPRRLFHTKRLDFKALKTPLDAEITHPAAHNPCVQRFTIE